MSYFFIFQIAKPTNKVPAEHLILERRRVEDLREKSIADTKNNKEAFLRVKEITQFNLMSSLSRTIILKIVLILKIFIGKNLLIETSNLSIEKNIVTWKNVIFLLLYYFSVIVTMGEDNRPTNPKEQGQARSGKTFIVHRHDLRKAKRQVCINLFCSFIEFVNFY